MSTFQIVHARNLSFCYFQSEVIIENLDFSLAFGQKIAITGSNASGKSTFAKILAGELQPDQGILKRVGSVRFVTQDFTSQCDGLSGGELRMRAIEKAFRSNADLLILDEVTNDLDISNKRKFLKMLEGFGGASILVTHDPLVLDSVDGIWELRNSKLQYHPPGYEAYAQRIGEEERQTTEKIFSLKSQKRKAKLHAEENLQRQLKKTARGKKQGIKSNLPKAVLGAKKRQAQNTLAKLQSVHEKIVAQTVENIQTMEKNLRQRSTFDWDFEVTRVPESKLMASVKDFKLKGSSQTMSFEIFGPKKVQLCGKNGVGKSTLLQALANDLSALKRVDGLFYINSALKLFDQRLARFQQNVSLWQFFQEKTRLPLTESRSILGRLAFDQKEQERKLWQLSGGEKMRVELALTLCDPVPPQILLLDEPTNHLDLDSRRILQKFLNDYQGAIIVVSHDTRFMESISIDEKITLGA